MAKTAILDRVEIDMQTGVIQLRWNKLSSDGDVTGYHRTSIDPITEIDTQMSEVENHLTAMGFESNYADDVAKIQQIADTVRIPK